MAPPPLGLGPSLLTTHASGRGSHGPAPGGRSNRDVTSARAWPRFGLRGPRRGLRRWQRWEEAAWKAEELEPGPIPAFWAATLTLQRTGKRNRPDGPLSPNRALVRLGQSGQP